MKNLWSRNIGWLLTGAGWLCLFLGCLCWADPVLPTLISDHMVLQQDREIHIWGKADAREAIEVSFAGHDSKTTADGAGKWSVQLPKLAAGGPFTLRIRGKKEVVVKDVMIGEVWVASGQSNMTFALEGTENALTEVPNADHPQIRLFTVPQRIAVTPQDDTLPARWQLCAPDTAKTFSAVAYFFARAIQRKLNVPVGVIESAWPGTPIERYISREVLQSDRELKPLVEEWDRSSPAIKKFAETPRVFQLEFDDFELISSSSTAPAKPLANFDDGSSGLTTGGTFSYNWTGDPNSAFEVVSPGRSGRGFAARVAGSLDGSQESILNASYKQDNAAADLSSYDGIRFWVRGNGSFRFRSKQPTISDYDDYAAPVMKATNQWQPITIRFRDLHQDGWGVVRPFTQDALTGFSFECLTVLEYAEMPPGGLYDGMIAPLLAYPFRGALWYQGESNALQAHQYRKLLPALIESWREASGQPEMEFLIVQLPNHGSIPDEPGDSAWAELREAQLLAAEHVAHTGLAVTIDVGDPKDLHPHRKLEVGERLARWALGTVYQQPGEYSGPLFASAEVEGNAMRIRFTHVGTGLELHGGDELQGFALAGVDHTFHWATARIEGNTVVASSPDVPVPVAVRYAWGDSPRCNLFNQDGLPASPFRSDDWPGITSRH
jgi:sialate O-acetylesterase